MESRHRDAFLSSSSHIQIFLSEYLQSLRDLEWWCSSTYPSLPSKRRPLRLSLITADMNLVWKNRDATNFGRETIWDVRSRPKMHRLKAQLWEVISEFNTLHYLRTFCTFCFWFQPELYVGFVGAGPTSPDVRTHIFSCLRTHDVRQPRFMMSVRKCLLYCATLSSFLSISSSSKISTEIESAPQIYGNKAGFSLEAIRAPPSDPRDGTEIPALSGSDSQWVSIFGSSCIVTMLISTAGGSQ